jgi:two-component system sensor histidine kinase KdpD
MEPWKLYRTSTVNQYVISLALVSIVSILCYWLSEYIGYRVVALILLVTVSFVAMLFDILPVLLTAVISALVWDFFFIPPKFTFTIDNTEDLLMFLMYFVIALLNAVFSYKARKMQKAAVLKEEKSKTLQRQDDLIVSISKELDEQRAAIPYQHIIRVKDLLYQSRFDSGPIHPKKDNIDLNLFILKIVKEVEKSKSNYQIHLNIPSNLPLFKLDEQMMELALFNLLSDTVKNAQKRSIEIYATLHINVLQLVLEDDNKELTARDAEMLKKQLYEEHLKPTDKDLGLSIAGRIINLHKGVIQVKSKSEGGLKIVIDLPAEISPITD